MDLRFSGCLIDVVLNFIFLHFLFISELRKKSANKKLEPEETENLANEPDKAEAAHEGKRLARKAERPQHLRQCDGCGETFTLLRDLKKHKCTVITLPLHWAPLNTSSVTTSSVASK